METEEKIIQIKKNIHLIYWMFKLGMITLVLGVVGMSVMAITMICVILGAQDLVKLITEF